MEFKDRVANKPNRVKITYEDSGASSYAVVELADEPIEEGTPLNKSTFDEMQKELMPAFEDAEYKGCYYRWVDGEKEWINPPLMCNNSTDFPIEYRTAERWNGKPVYTFVQKMTLDADVDLITGGFALREGAISDCVRFVARTNRYHLPYNLRENAKYIDFRITTNAKSFTVQRGTTASTNQDTLFIQLWYTKK